LKEKTILNGVLGKEWCQSNSPHEDGVREEEEEEEEGREGWGIKGSKRVIKMVQVYGRFLRA